MRHPFDLDFDELKPRELDFSEEITSEEAANVGGGLSFATTEALGEEGGDDYPIDIKPIDGPIATTLALGEEGGCYPEPWPIKPQPPTITTYALGEEGGYSTMAIGEEGGCGWLS